MISSLPGSQIVGLKYRANGLCNHSLVRSTPGGLTLIQRAMAYVQLFLAN